MTGWYTETQKGPAIIFSKLLEYMFIIAYLCEDFIFLQRRCTHLTDAANILSWEFAQLINVSPKQQ